MKPSEQFKKDFDRKMAGYLREMAIQVRWLVYKLPEHGRPKRMRS